MNHETERWIRRALLAVGVVVILVILAHAWKVLTTPAPAEEGRIEAEAADEMWVEESKLESNKNMTLSLKEAVLGAAQQEKNLQVFTQKMSDIIKVTDNGRLPLQLSAKYQYIKYSGTAVYTVDLSGIDDAHLAVDEEAKTLTIYIPHTECRLDLNEEETQADQTEKIGIFSVGDLKQSEEERAEVIARVRTNMEQKLEEEKIGEIADRMAVLSVWEIYQPVVSKVSPEYTVAVEFG